MKNHLIFVFVFFLLSLCLAGENHELRMLLESNIPSRDMIENLKREIHRSVYGHEGPQKKINTLFFEESPCNNYQKELQKIPPCWHLSPSRLLLTLSKEMEKSDFVFAIRGLPTNNFFELSKKQIHLTKQRMITPLWFDPISFMNNKIEFVPSFALIDDDEYHKISGKKIDRDFFEDS